MPAQVQVIYHDAGGQTVSLPVDHEQNSGIYVALLQIKLNEAISHIQDLEDKLYDGIPDKPAEGPDDKEYLGP
jgi:hypothetical protein